MATGNFKRVDGDFYVSNKLARGFNKIGLFINSFARFIIIIIIGNSHLTGRLRWSGLFKARSRFQRFHFNSPEQFYTSVRLNVFLFHHIITVIMPS